MHPPAEDDILDRHDADAGDHGPMMPIEELARLQGRVERTRAIERLATDQQRRQGRTGLGLVGDLEPRRIPLGKVLRGEVFDSPHHSVDPIRSKELADHHRQTPRRPEIVGVLKRDQR